MTVSRGAAIWRALERILFPASAHDRMAHLDLRRRTRLTSLLSNHRSGLAGIEELEIRRVPAGFGLTVEQVVEIIPPPDAEYSTPLPETIPVIIGPGLNMPVEIVPPAPSGDPDPRSIPVYAGPGTNTLVSITSGSAADAIDPDDIPVFAGPGDNQPVEVSALATGIPMNAPRDVSQPDIAAVPAAISPLENMAFEPAGTLDQPTPPERSRPHFGSRDDIDLLQQATEPPVTGFVSAQDLLPSAPGMIQGPDLNALLFDLVHLAEMSFSEVENAVDAAISPSRVEEAAAIPIIIAQPSTSQERELPPDPKTPIPESPTMLPAIAAAMASAGIWMRNRESKAALGESAINDHRRCMRSAVRENVELAANAGGQPMIALARDISHVGMGILHHHPLLGERVQVHFPVDGQFHTCWARVRWTRRLETGHYTSGIELEEPLGKQATSS